MKITMKLAVIGGMLGGLIPIQAQVIVQNVNIALKGVVQGAEAEPVRVSNKELLSVLGTQLETDFTGGKILLISDGEGANLVVRQRGGGGDTVVSTFLSKTQISDGVVTDRSTEDRTDLTTYSINEYTFDDGEEAGTEFTVQGYTTERTRSVSSGGEVIGDATDTKSSVAGSGEIGGATAILQGNINVTGRKVEQTGD
jgi:hypothetical protein